MNQSKDSGWGWSEDTRSTIRVPYRALQYAVWGGLVVCVVVALGVPLIAPTVDGSNANSYFNSPRGDASRFEGTGTDILRARCGNLPLLSGPNATVQTLVLQHEAIDQARDYVGAFHLPSRRAVASVHGTIV